MAHSSDSVQALARDAVLVHLGMHKTGTTAMQSLFASLRPQLSAAGATYPGTRDAHHTEARSLVRKAVGWESNRSAPPPLDVWRDLVREVAGIPGRVVLSSEFFSVADAEQAATLVDDLGRDRIHLLLGVRSLAATAVSTWQQTLKQGRVSAIERWAQVNFPRGDTPPRLPAFWQQWDLGSVVARFADAVGSERMTVVVVSPQERDRLPRTFEQLLDLDSGVLVGQQPKSINRGMTAAEAEFVRQVNTAVRGRMDWNEYRRVVRRGLIHHLVETRAPEPDEPKAVLPGWARDEAQAAGRRYAERIAATGVRVVGDLDELAAVPDPVSAADATPGSIPVEVAVQAVLGAIRPADTPDLADVSARDLAKVLATRVRRKATRATSGRSRRGAT